MPLPEVPGSRCWMSQRLSIESNTTRKNKSMKQFLMIFCSTVDPKSHQRGFIQQLLGTDAEIHNQSFGRILGILLQLEEEGLSEPEVSWTPQDQDSQNQVSSAQRGSQRPKCQSGSLHGSGLCSLRICYDWVSWCSFVTSYSESQGCFWCFHLL